jgi:hypothetical protein
VLSALLNLTSVAVGPMARISILAGLEEYFSILFMVFGFF